MKNRTAKKFTIGLTAAVITVGLSGGPLLAQSTQGRTFQANLSSLNKSGDTGTATITVVDDNTVKVNINSKYASERLAHAQHLHIGAQNLCPPLSAAGDDEFITSAEGQPFYGPIKVSLTTTGAVDAASGLAVDRFSVASEQGDINYERTFDLPEGVTTDQLENAVIVQHGIAELFPDKQQYDGDPRSSLDQSLPLETTIPASCGEFSAMPVGGVGAGGGSTAGVENAPALAFGAAAIIGAAAILIARKRNATNV